MDDATDVLAAQAEAFEQTATRIRELNERLLEGALAAGGEAVHTYERALLALAAVAERTGGATPLEWLTWLSHLHADFVRDVSTAHTAALRVLLD
jgi:hypothetical protein